MKFSSLLRSLLLVLKATKKCIAVAITSDKTNQSLLRSSSTTWLVSLLKTKSKRPSFVIIKRPVASNTRSETSSKYPKIGPTCG